MIVCGRKQGSIKGFNIYNEPLIGRPQPPIILESGKTYIQSFTISRYFNFKPDIYDIYIESAAMESYETYLYNIEEKDKGAKYWQGTLVSNTITIEVMEKK